MGADDTVSLLLQVKADTSDLLEKLGGMRDKGKEATSGLAADFGELGRSIADFFALDKIKDFAVSAVEKFAAVQKKTQELADTVRSAGGDWDKSAARVKAYVDQTVAGTSYAKEEVLDSLQAITLRVGDVNVAMQLNEEAIKLSRARHMQLAEAANTVALAFEGQRMGIMELARALGDSGPKAKQVGDLFADLDKKASKLGADADTVTFKLNSAKTTWDNMMEDSGGRLAPVAVFWAKLASEYIPDFIKAIDTAAVYIEAFFAKMEANLDAFGQGLQITAQLFENVWKHPIDAWKDYIAESKAIQAGLKATMVADEKNTASEVDAIWKTSVETRVKVETDGIAKIAQANQKRADDATKQLEKEKEDMQRMGAEYEKLAENLVKAALKAKGAGKAMAEAIIEGVADALAGIMTAYAAAAEAKAVGDIADEDWVDAAAQEGAAAEFSIAAGVIKGIASSVKLAEGGIVSSPTRAVIGEGGEPEAVIPLSKASSMGFGSGSSTHIGELHFHVETKDASSFQSAGTQRSIERGLLTTLDRVKQRQGNRFSGSVA